MIETDAVLEQIACELEQPDFLDLQGIAAKRKRDREDADLRLRTRQEQRRELARWVRSFKTGKGNSPVSFLRRIQEGTDQFEWGPDVAAALVAQLATLTVEFDLNTHLLNCTPRFRLTLTEGGGRVLNDALETA